MQVFLCACGCVVCDCVLVVATCLAADGLLSWRGPCGRLQPVRGCACEVVCATAGDARAVVVGV
jgi:hypothetical protein